jgi:hypothetical protein
MYVQCPGGAGGHWLSHTVYCLEQLSQDRTTHIGINYHDVPQSSQMIMDHFLDRKGHTHYTVFSSVHSFNLYLNGLIKNPTFLQELSFSEKFRSWAHESSYKFSAGWHRSYVAHIDLHYDHIFTDPDRFCKDLFALLDRHQIRYRSCADTLLYHMTQFRNTCPDPLDHFDNFDSVYWLAWCCGILNHTGHNAGINFDCVDLKDVRDRLLPYRSLFTAHTQPVMARTHTAQSH